MAIQNLYENPLLPEVFNSSKTQILTPTSNKEVHETINNAKHLDRTHAENDAHSIDFTEEKMILEYETNQHSWQL